MSALAEIPLARRDLYGSLPPHIKSEANQWLQAIRDLDAAKNGAKAEVAAAWASKLGVAVKSVWSKRSDYRKRGGEALVNMAKAGADWWEQKDKLPVKFKEFVCKMAEDNKLASEPAFRAVVRQLKRWRLGDQTAKIPGYDSPPPGDPPRGWSRRNLARCIKSHFALLAARRGQSHAVGKCGPQTFTTRTSQWFMSQIPIDDVWHDNFVVAGKQIVRVLELDALDVFSGALLQWGTKPRMTREDGTQDSKLAGYVPLLLTGMFCNYGYSPHGTMIFSEHGTAIVPEAIAKILYDASNKLITVRKSGMTGEEQAIVGWWGLAKGNSRFKARLEMHHRLKHLELGSVPGQTGMNRETRPEFTHGILCEDDDLLKAMTVLEKKNPARAAQLRTRLLDYHSAFVPLLTEVYRIINERDWHKLEGWNLIPGNVEIQYRLAPDSEAWLQDADFQRLPPVAQDVILAAAQTDKRYLRPRRASPADVVRRERVNNVRLPDWAIADILVHGAEPKTLKVKGAYFNLFQDADIYPEPLRYESVVTKSDGARMQLADDNYTVTPNPFDLSRLFVRDAGNHYVGWAARSERIDGGSEDRLRRSWGHQAKRLHELTEPMRERHAEDIKEETRRLKENADLLKEPDMSPEARRIEQKAKRAFGSQQEALNQL